MKRSVLMLALVIGVLAAGAVFAANGQEDTICIPVPQSAQQPVMQCPPAVGQQPLAVTVDDRYVYVVRGDELFKYRKTDLALVARVPVAGVDVSRIGRGPSMKRETPLYPSGSRSDLYAPSGVVDTQMDRAYDYIYE